MCEAEVQPLVAFVFSRGQVFLLLLMRHSVPRSLPFRIDSHIEELRAYEQHNVVCD